MPKITLKPHPEICPEGKVFEAATGTSICDAMLAQHIHIEHACEKSCACTTCHVYVRTGMDSMDEATDAEAIKQALRELESVSEVYVSRRMNASVGESMTGKHIDSYEKQDNPS